jgi:hypothetical protein
LAYRTPRWLALLGVVCSVVVANEARAEGSEEVDGGDGGGDAFRTSSLSWVRLRGAEACIGTRALAEAVETRLQRRVIVSAAQADLSIEGRVEPHAAPRRGYRAVVVVSSPDGTVLGERTIETDESDCGALDEALVLVIAVMIDPEAALAPQPDEPDAPLEAAEAADEGAAEVTSRESADPSAGGISGGGTDTDAVPRPDATVPSAPLTAEATPSPAGLRVDLAMSFQVGLGALPGASLGPESGLLLDPPGFWPIELDVAGFIGAVAERDGGPGAARFDLVSGGAFVCAPYERRSLRIHGCLGIRAGAVRAEGVAFDETHRAWRPIVDGAARVRLLWNPWRSLVLRVGATLAVPFLRDSFLFVDEGGQRQLLFEPFPVNAAFEIGLGIIIPRPSSHSRGR